MSNGLTCLLVFLQLYSVKGSPPRKLESISVTSVGANFLVQWRPPTVSYGPILHYQVVYNLLPEEDSVTMTTNGQTFVLIPVNEHPGRLYRIVVFAENSEGLSRPSRPRYVRVTHGCGGTRYVIPETSINVISPFYPTRFEHNSLCSWILSTNASYVLSVTINDFNFSANSCTNDFISLRDKSVDHGGRLCNISEGAFLSEGNETELSLHTGPNGSGRGFNVTVRSIVPLPKQPANVKVIAMNNVITVSWSPPTNYNDDHITAYRVRYSVLPSSKRFVITLSTAKRRFPISTRGHEGQLYIVKVSAMHRFQEGPTSSPAYVRASCSRKIVLAPGNYINITSPGYPQHYLPQVLCNWRITSGSGQPFYFRIAALDVEESLFCSSDYVSVSLWGNTRRCGAVSTPEEFTMVSGELEVKFVTDNHKENTGFIIEIKSETSSLLSPNMTERTTKSTEFRTSTETVPSIRTVTHWDQSLSTLNLQEQRTQITDLLTTISTHHGDDSTSTKSSPLSSSPSSVNVTSLANMSKTTLKSIKSDLTTAPVITITSDVPMSRDESSMAYKTEMTTEVMSTSTTRILSTATLDKKTSTFEPNTLEMKTTDLSVLEHNYTSTHTPPTQSQNTSSQVSIASVCNSSINISTNQDIGDIKNQDINECRNHTSTTDKLSISIDSLKQSRDRKSSSLTTVLIAVVGISLVLVTSCVVTLRFRKYKQNRRRIHITITPIHDHDIVLQSKQTLLEDAVLPTRVSPGLRAGSLPSRSTLQRTMVEDGIKNDVSKFSCFIEDTASLEKRLRLTRTKRRISF